MAPYTSPLAEELAPGLLDRFQRYVRVDTQSRRDGNDGTPSTPGQLDLSRMLVEELQAAGLEDAELDDNGYVMATLPATVDGDTPVVGLIAHVDTSPDAPGAGGRADRPPRLRRRADRAAAQRHRARSRGDARAGRQGGPRHRHLQRRHAAGRRRQGRRRRDHGRGRPPGRPPRAAAPDAARSASRPTRRSARARRTSTSSASGPAAPTRWTARPWASSRTRPSPAPRPS